MALLRAPDGSERDVPEDQVAHYIGLGAVPVGASTGAPGGTEMRAGESPLLRVLPSLGGAAGSFLGPAGAGLFGGGGEALHQLIQYATDNPNQPESSAEALQRILFEGGKQGALGFGGGLLAKGAGALGGAAVRRAASPALAKASKAVPKFVGGLTALQGGLDPSALTRALVVYALSRAATSPAVMRGAGAALTSGAGQQVAQQTPRAIEALWNVMQ